MIAYDLRKTKPKEFLAVTGLTQEEFLHLLPAVDTLYQAQITAQTSAGKARKRKPGGGKGNLPQIENKPRFLLTSAKAYARQTFLGRHFGIRQPQANSGIPRLLPRLQQGLTQLLTFVLQVYERSQRDSEWIRSHFA